MYGPQYRLEGTIKHINGAIAENWRR